MQVGQRTIGTSLLFSMLITGAGCSTGTGAAAGGGFGAILGGVIDRQNPLAGALIGAGAGAITGAIIGHINEMQQERLKQQSPETLEKIQHNDAIASASSSSPAPAQQSPATPAAAGGTAAATPASYKPAPTAQAEPAPQPLTVDDVKAMSSAGIKSDVIAAEIGSSKSKFTASDIAAAQSANPPVDASVIDVMKKTSAS